MTLPEPARRARRLGVALLGATFVVGSLTGAAFDRVLGAREPGTEARSTARCDGRRGEADIFAQLGLTDEQRARIGKIFERRREQTAAFWEREGHELRGIVDSTRAEIRNLLTPWQQAEYDRLREQRRALERARRETNRSSRGRQE